MNNWCVESILSGHPERYAKQLHRSIGFRHSLTTLIAISFYFIQFPFLILGTPNPFSTHGIVEMLSDRMSTAGFVLYTIFTLPIFLGTELSAWLLSRLGQKSFSNRLRELIYPEAVSSPYLY